MDTDFDGFEKDALRLMADLRKHNDRAWFQKNKKRFDAAVVEPARAFVEALGERLQDLDGRVSYDPRINGSILRLARDTRFSKDKTPYSEHVTLRFWLGKDKKGPGFWLRFNDRMFGIGAGAHVLDDKVLGRFRKRVADEKTGAALAKSLAGLKRKGYETMGEHYKRVPRGFDADHPREALLRHRGLFVFQETKPPSELGSAKLVPYCVKRCKEVAPVLDWLSGC